MQTKKIGCVQRDGEAMGRETRDKFKEKRSKRELPVQNSNLFCIDRAPRIFDVNRRLALHLLFEPYSNPWNRCSPRSRQVSSWLITIYHYSLKASLIGWWVGWLFFFIFVRVCFFLNSLVLTLKQIAWSFFYGSRAHYAKIKYKWCVFVCVCWQHLGAQLLRYSHVPPILPIVCAT